MEETKSTNNKSFSVEFLRLFVVHQKSIYTYILALVHNPSEAEDIMQDVVTLMWERFGEFKSGTNFGAWGITVARYKVLEYHHRKKSEYAFFSDRLFERLSHISAEKINKIEDQTKALQQCLLKLQETDRELIQNRYEKGLSIKQIAEDMQRSVTGMYKVMGRIHRALIRCVRLTLDAWEMQG
jgi:RNA polymerase sigma-70 factor, ECF subfamily